MSTADGDILLLYTIYTLLEIINMNNVATSLYSSLERQNTEPRSSLGGSLRVSVTWLIVSVGHLAHWESRSSLGGSLRQMIEILRSRGTMTSRNSDFSSRRISCVYSYRDRSLQIRVITFAPLAWKVHWSENKGKCTRAGANSGPELDLLANFNSNSGIWIGIELTFPSLTGIGIELELPVFELELNWNCHNWNWNWSRNCVLRNWIRNCFPCNWNPIRSPSYPYLQ